jgi:hypothetical protein
VIANVNAVSPLNGAIDGSPQKRAAVERQRRQRVEQAVNLLHPQLAAGLAAAGIDLLRVEVESHTSVFVHNSRDWRRK